MKDNRGRIKEYASAVIYGALGSYYAVSMMIMIVFRVSTVWQFVINLSGFLYLLCYVSKHISLVYTKTVIGFSIIELISFMISVPLMLRYIYARNMVIGLEEMVTERIMKWGCYSTLALVGLLKVFGIYFGKRVKLYSSPDGFSVSGRSSD